MKNFSILLLLLPFLASCINGSDLGQQMELVPTATSKPEVSLPAIWTPTAEGEIPRVLIPTFTMTPTSTSFPPPTLEISPASPSTTPAPTSSRTSINYLEKFITATPFYGDNGPGTLFQGHPKCPFQFMVPPDWEVDFVPEYVDSEYCILRFRPGNWLNYIEEAFLALPEYTGQIVYWETSSHGVEFGFSYDDGEWFIAGDGIDLGQRIPLINAGGNYILRGEIDVKTYSRETDAYAGLQPYLMFFISNSEGRAISIESGPDEVDDGLELILRTISFTTVDE